MAITISLYNHTAKLFADGSNSPLDTYKVKLLTAATFDATHTTLAATAGTEVVNGGYTAGGVSLSGVTVSTVTNNDAAFDANDVTVTATGSTLVVRYAILYNATDANSPPLAFIDLGVDESAAVGNDFKIAWNAAGIFLFSVT